MGPRYAGLGRLVGWLTRIEIVASVLALTTICVLTLAVILAREVFGSSILWAEEISLLLMKVVVFFGAAAMYATRSFIRVDGLVGKLGPGARDRVQMAAWLLAAAFAAVVMIKAIQTYPTQIQARSYLLELPKFYFFVPLIIGAASIFLTSVYYLLVLATGPGDRGEFGSSEERAGIPAGDRGPP